MEERVTELEQKVIVIHNEKKMTYSSTLANTGSKVMERCIKSVNEFAAQLSKKRRKKQTSCYALSHHFDVFTDTFPKTLQW